MANLFNSRSPWSPEGRNLLNASGWEGYEAPSGDRGSTASLLDQVLQSLGMPRTVMSVPAYGDPMPVMRSGEVTSSPEPLSSREDTFAGEVGSDQGVPELPPWVKVNGQDSSGYSKIALARGNMAAAREIALKQFPGASIRDDTQGNPIIRLPEGATRTDWRVNGADFEGNPTFEAREVPIGGEFYLNKSGLSSRDLADFAVNQVFKGIGSGLGGLIGSTGAMPIVGAGLGAGLGIEAMDAAARQAGSSQDIDWGDVAAAAAGTTAFKGAVKRLRTR